MKAHPFTPITSGFFANNPIPLSNYIAFWIRGNFFAKGSEVLQNSV